MDHDAEKLRADALGIWRAGVDAVRSEQLVSQHVELRGDELFIGEDVVSLKAVRRIVVVGAGKAGAGMAVGLESALGNEVIVEKRVQGLVNVPADCCRPTERIALHPARPAGVNEPTHEGVVGSENMLRLVRSLGPEDLCICLLSGGASALLPAPITGLTLEDKQAITRLLSGAGANIHQLNTVRKQLSRVKGGRLAAASGAGMMKTLIISDVIGDPLEIIASGPTVRNTATADDQAAVFDKNRVYIFDTTMRDGEQSPGASMSLEEKIQIARVFDELGIADNPVARRVIGLLGTAKEVEHSQASKFDQTTNTVIGNNQLAVDAAGIEARRRGYLTESRTAEKLEGSAEVIGIGLARAALQLRDHGGARCLITGGEPTVQLVEESCRGRGGRNQQLVLAGLQSRISRDHTDANPLAATILLSGGTDGEDGPTDAAGAFADAKVAANAHLRGLDPLDYLGRNDAYQFFSDTGGLIKTGPTHTNVCDVRVVLTHSPGDQ